MSKGKEFGDSPGAVSQDGSQNVKQLVRELLTTRDSLSTGDVVALTGLSRQAVHYHLRQMVLSGELRREGARRGTKYLRDAALVATFPIAGLEEHRVWEEVFRGTPAIAALRRNVLSILRYALTEIVNNAIDHSGAEKVRVSVWDEGPAVACRVADGGVGAFRHVRERLGLQDDFAALQQISKGKTTTDPERHTGEGIFFVSKSTDVFVMEANGLRWTVDNLLMDQAVGQAKESAGTSVWWRIAKDSLRSLDQVFRAFTDEELRFSRSKTVLRLFALGESFVSRSEAKRVAEGLDRFDEVIIDFSGVVEVGQAFVHELFRVWTGDHPGTRLIPANMVEAVRMMVTRGLPGKD